MSDGSRSVGEVFKDLQYNLQDMSEGAVDYTVDKVEQQLNLKGADKSDKKYTTDFRTRFKKDRWEKRKSLSREPLLEKLPGELVELYNRDPKVALSFIQAPNNNTESVGKAREILEAVYFIDKLPYGGEDSEDIIPEDFKKNKTYLNNIYLRKAIERGRLQEAVSNKKDKLFDWETVFPEYYNAVKADANLFTEIVATAKDINPARIIPPLMNSLLSDIEGSYAQQLRLTYKEKPTTSVVLEEMFDPFDIMVKGLTKTLKTLKGSSGGRVTKDNIEALLRSPLLHEAVTKAYQHVTNTLGPPAKAIAKVINPKGEPSPILKNVDVILGTVGEIMGGKAVRGISESLSKTSPRSTRNVVGRVFTDSDIGEIRKLNEQITKNMAEGIPTLGDKIRIRKLRDKVNFGYKDLVVRTLLPTIPSTTRNLLFDLTNVDQDLTLGDARDLAVVNSLAYLFSGLTMGAAIKGGQYATGGQVRAVPKKLRGETTSMDKWGTLGDEVRSMGLDPDRVLKPDVQSIQNLVNVIKENGIEKNSKILDQILGDLEVSPRELLENVKRNLNSVEVVSDADVKQLANVTSELESMILKASRPGKVFQPVVKLPETSLYDSGRFVRTQLAPESSGGFTGGARILSRSALEADKLRSTTRGVESMVGGKIPSAEEVEGLWGKVADEFYIDPQSNIKGQISFGDKVLDIPIQPRGMDKEQFKKSPEWVSFTKRLSKLYRDVGPGVDPKFAASEYSTLSRKSVRDIVKEAGGKKARLGTETKDGLGFSAEQWQRGWKSIRSELTRGLGKVDKPFADGLLDSMFEDYRTIGFFTGKFSGDKDRQLEASQALLNAITHSRRDPASSQDVINLWKKAQERAKDLIDRKYDNMLREAGTKAPKIRIARSRAAAKKELEIYENRIISQILNSAAELEDLPMYTRIYNLLKSTTTPEVWKNVAKEFSISTLRKHSQVSAKESLKSLDDDIVRNKEAYEYGPAPTIVPVIKDLYNETRDPKEGSPMDKIRKKILSWVPGSPPPVK